ncbi:SRPBCC domain-containing protein [Saccharomonospora piscinae]|uniref:Polyketide cyclase n=1 Tax=Saccharomonospora piscinae TaxID=687388 RepID=A0A1V9A0Z6_SACPI|nr:SRPBCC domain-containing protein [Saccharomonospora piscinae]OQO90817.1 polyketide cyclase [Saccharomonospora piscinae]TLW93492.1 polyketide cyclase [Saccharomonospora piscinae]
MNPDRIERDVLIDAPADRVWATLVEFSWVDDGGRRGLTPRTGERFVAHNAQEGDYPIVIEKSEPPRYLAYRWASAFEGTEPAEGNSTLVEFTLAEEQGGTRLTVVESGFATLPQQHRAQALDENTGGWEAQLDALRKSVAA